MNGINFSNPIREEHKTLPTRGYFTEPVIFHESDGLKQLKSHITHLEELNRRLKYMMKEIHSLITNPKNRF